MTKLFAMAGVLVLVALPAAAATKVECRAHYYQGSNAALLTGRYIGVAKDNAVLSWGARVLASIGPDYSDWKLAHNRSFHCVKRAGLYKCTARARACRKVK